MDSLRVRCCLYLVIYTICCIACLTHVSGFECFSCNSLGIGDTHSNDDCVNFDQSKIGTEPCQVGDGQVGRCVVFKGSITIDPPFFDPQTAEGTLRYCEVYDENEAPASGCYAATEIPSDLLSGVFSVASFIGVDEVIDGESCYCSDDRCNTDDMMPPEESGLECYSCNSLGLGDTHSNDDCVNFDESKIGSEPCQAGAGQVGICAVFKGSITVDPPLIDPQTAKGTLRYCEVYDENQAPEDKCYTATEIPSDLLSGVFTAAYLVGADEVIKGDVCYCSSTRCNTDTAIDGDDSARGSNSATTLAFSHVNIIVLFSFSIYFVLHSGF